MRSPAAQGRYAVQSCSFVIANGSVSFCGILLVLAGILLTRNNIKPEDAVLASRDNDFNLRGFTWNAATQTYSNKYSGPCAINCSNIEGVYAFHHGGAQAVLGDGSVRFLHQDVSTRLLARLVTRAGGETVDWSDY